MRRPFFKLYELFDGFLVEKIATYAVTGFGWITDDFTVFKGFDNLFDQAKLRIYRINFKQHIFDISFVHNWWTIHINSSNFGVIKIDIIKNEIFYKDALL